MAVSAHAGAGEAILPADLGPGFTGYELFDPGLVQLLQGPYVEGNHAMVSYTAAREAVDLAEGCPRVDPPAREEIEQAYQQMAAGQHRYVSARQWTQLRRALQGSHKQPPLRGVLECGAFALQAPHFDERLEGRLLAHTEMSRSANGAVDDRADALRPALGLGMAGGTLVNHVLSGSNAERAGLRANDVVLSVQGTAVATIYGIEQVLRAYAPGDRVQLKVRRTALDLASGASSQALEIALVLESRAALLTPAQAR
ncbi:PDZ domain-containing protein [Stenotrophomonas lactitubi]|uniref:PDZ domain-containing protein n=1 Tax=Stenotrophomonas lactitubi TaxID=2045214 RepID=UPI002248A5C2|nr:PDZ domain-containing protein [Stenotrophomonas lactitubi]MCX2894171.1 PDZ domain-containing protein [Stenotrophomonas lactitubi]